MMIPDTAFTVSDTVVEQCYPPHFVVVVFDGEFSHLGELNMQSVAAVVDVLVVEEGFSSCCFFSIGVLNESMVLVVTDERHNLLYLTTSVEHLQEMEDH